MTEEVKDQVSNDTPDQPELTPTQQKAVEQGWKPKEQFEGEEDDFIDAAEFVRRGELFGKIEHQSKELKAVRNALEALKQHNSKIETAAYDRALKSLKDSHRAAVIDGEPEKAFKIEDQIEAIQKEKATVVAQAAAPAVAEQNVAFQSWMDNNKWYTKDVAMQAYADRVGTEMARRGVPQDEVLRKVAEEVRQEFPHKFQNAKTERTSAVEASSRGGSSTMGASRQSLSEDERNIMRKIVGTGVMSEKEYMAQLKKSKE